jgi:hypothetical protein
LKSGISFLCASDGILSAIASLAFMIIVLSKLASRQLMPVASLFQLVINLLDTFL